MLYKFLFPSKPDGAATSAILLIVRIIFGVLLMNHGIEKWSNYQELSAVFPDPLGVGSPLSLGLAIFGELACSMAFIIGFLYRLAMLPMIFTMGWHSLLFTETIRLRSKNWLSYIWWYTY